jgi:hypothetical protein
MAPMTTNESYCTFSLSSDLTAGGLPSEEEIAKDLESNDAKVCLLFGYNVLRSFYRMKQAVINWKTTLSADFHVIICGTNCLQTEIRNKKSTRFHT